MSSRRPGCPPSSRHAEQLPPPYPRQAPGIDGAPGHTRRGIGINAEDMRRIIERFYRGRSDVSAVTRGAGLGLAVCRGIVEARAGKIWVDSQQSTGTSVSFTLPTIETDREEIL